MLTLFTYSHCFYKWRAGGVEELHPEFDMRMCLLELEENVASCLLDMSHCHTSLESDTIFISRPVEKEACKAPTKVFKSAV